MRADAVTDTPFPPERLQHDRLTRDSGTTADSEGGIARPWRVEGLLARLERHGDIGRAERMAGEKFQELFARANFGCLRASDMARSCHAPVTGELNGIAAREECHRALTALGGHGSAAASAAWFILGEQLSLREWAAREGWNGRAVSGHVAKGILLAVLTILRHHFKS